jgi:hypothetical protein
MDAAESGDGQASGGANYKSQIAGFNHGERKEYK